MRISATFRTLLLAVTLFGGTVSAQPSDCSFAEDRFNFYVVNDTGRNGYYEQKPIAGRMGELAEEIGPEFVLAPGDIHHFEGVQSVDDPLWMTNYELIYSHPELMIDWYPCLGNHEYRGNTQAVIDYSDVSRRWVMPARYYTRSFDEEGVRVRVVWVDTAPMIDKYRNDPEGYPDAGRQNYERQLKWLDKVLSEADEDWVIVAGHHPIYAQTSKSDTERSDLQRRLDPILRKHHVDMYLCGHIHNFQHLRMPGSDVDYVVNSSGSLAREVEPTEGTVFCSGEPGFSVVTADKQTLTLRMMDKEGKVLHTVTRRK